MTRYGVGTMPKGAPYVTAALSVAGATAMFIVAGRLGNGGGVAFVVSTAGGSIGTALLIAWARQRHRKAASHTRAAERAANASPSVRWWSTAGLVGAAVGGGIVRDPTVMGVVIGSVASGALFVTAIYVWWEVRNRKKGQELEPPPTTPRDW